MTGVAFTTSSSCERKAMVLPKVETNHQKTLGTNKNSTGSKNAD